MNIELYNQKRDELSTLLEDVVSNLEQIDDKYPGLDLTTLRDAKNNIAAIRKKVYEDIFKIVLVAKFQGGKSTSFNAMTGGSCYSPMGNGAIKCSASPVIAKNVIDSADTGVTITMRSNKELSDLLAAGGFIDIDVSSAESMNAAKEEWENRFNIWKEDPQIIKTDDERDMFFVAGFIFAFYNDPIVKKYLNQKTFSIAFDEISQYAKFPDKYIIRYSTNGPAVFSPEEVIYAFVSKIEVRVQSNEMSKIGASFVDAPGLFANEYDTRVTRSELLDASAVWYLLGAMQPGAEELKAIRECLELCKGRVFFSSNILNNRLARPQWIENVLPEINQHINNAVGESVEIRPYHALLALLYIQGEDFIANGKWGDDSVKDFLAKTCEKMGVPDSNRLSTEECWKILTRVAISGLYPFGLPEFTMLQNPLSPEGLVIIRRESNWDGTVEAIREFVINTKSKSILITDTSQKALELLNSLKNILKRREEDANSSFEEANVAYSKAERKLSEFMAFANERITEQLDGAAGRAKDKVIADDLHEDVLMGAVSGIADTAAPLIVEKTGLFKIVGAKAAEWGKKGWQWLKNKWNGYKKYTDPIENSYAVEINGIMQNAIKGEVDSRMSRWIQRIKEGNNSKFQEQVINSAKITYQLLENEWDKKCATDDLLKSLAPECPPMPAALLEGRFDTPEMMSFLGKMSFAEFVRDLVANTVGILFVAVMPEPITQTIAIIVTFFVLLYRKLMRAEEMEKEMCAKIKEQMIVNFSTNRSKFSEEMAPKIAVFREAVIDVIKKPFADVKKIFEDAKSKALNDFNKGKAHRDQVAQECKEIRVGYIEGAKGLEQRLMDYINETEPLCAVESDI